MASVEISLQVDEELWAELELRAAEAGRHPSDVLTEAIREFLERRPTRRSVTRHLEDSMDDNETWASF